MSLSLLLALSLLGSTPEPPAEHHFPLLTTAAIERFALPAAGAPYAVALDHLSMQISIHPNRAQPSLGKALRGTLCQTTGEAGGAVLLHCKSNQFDAFLSSSGTELTVMLLRGLPWRLGDDGPPRVFYPRPGQIDPCPGADAAGRGECAFASGNAPKANALFLKALTGPSPEFAALRLGDLALLGGDTETALGFYDRAGSMGPFGHLATERIAELTGDEATLNYLGNLENEPASIRPELALRLARWRAYRGDALGAASDLLGGEDTSYCVADATLCRRLLLGALRQPNAESFKAVALYLRLPERQVGPLAVELAEAAADSVAALGAPRFGANLRAAVFPQVDKDRQLAFLHRTADLFLQANDTARAEVICDFARARFGKHGACAPTGGRQDYGAGSSGRSGHNRPRSLESEIAAEIAEAKKAATAPSAPNAAVLRPKRSKEVASIPATSKP